MTSVFTSEAEATQSPTARTNRPGAGVLIGTLWFWIRCRIARVSTQGLSTSTWRTPQLITGGQIRLGSRCFFVNKRVRAQIGASDGGLLEMGDLVGVNEGATIVATHHISIGSYTRFGEFSSVFDTDYHQVEAEGKTRTAPVTIGDNVWIARGACVLPGVTIGDNSVISAQSVVARDVPPNSVVVGNPGRVVRTFDDAGKWRRQ